LREEEKAIWIPAFAGMVKEQGSKPVMFNRDHHVAALLVIVVRGTRHGDCPRKIN
jgi:hypothetical protein